MSEQWKYVDATERVVFRVLDNGRCESCLTTALPEEDEDGEPIVYDILAADPPKYSAEEIALQRTDVELMRISARTLEDMIEILADDLSDAGRPVAKAVADKITMRKALREQLR